MIKKISLFCLIAVFSLVLISCSGLRVRTPEALKNYKFITMEEMTTMENYPDFYFKDGPAKHLMTKKEKEVWRKLDTVSDKKEFLERFWQRRDPDLSTPENEFKTVFYYNAIYVKKNFTDEYMNSDWNSDRGKYFLILGRYDDQNRFTASSYQHQFDRERGTENPNRQRVDEVLAWEYSKLLSVASIRSEIESYFPYTYFRPTLYFIKGLTSGWQLALPVRYRGEIFQTLPNTLRVERERLLERIRELYVVNKLITFK